MRFELLYFDGCPHWELAAQRLDDVLGEHGLTATRVHVTTSEEADRLGFRGSPSVLIDGIDPFARGDEPTGLSCRVYPTPDGFAGVPTVEQLREVVGAVLGRPPF